MLVDSTAVSVAGYEFDSIAHLRILHHAICTEPIIEIRMQNSQSGLEECERMCTRGHVSQSETPDDAARQNEIKKFNRHNFLVKKIKPKIEILGFL